MSIEVIHQGRSSYVFGAPDTASAERVLIAAGVLGYDRANAEACAVRGGEVVFAEGAPDARSCVRFVNVIRSDKSRDEMAL